MIYLVATFKDDPFHPLDNPVPQLVTSPVVHQGGDVLVTATKCNRAKEDVAFISKAYYRNLATRELTLFRSGEGAREPGCKTIDYVNPVPPDLPIGVYQIEGVDTAVQGTQVQREPFRTQPFEVIE